MRELPCEICKDLTNVPADHSGLVICDDCVTRENIARLLTVSMYIVQFDHTAGDYHLVLANSRPQAISRARQVVKWDPALEVKGTARKYELDSNTIVELDREGNIPKLWRLRD